MCNGSHSDDDDDSDEEYYYDTPYPLWCVILKWTLSVLIILFLLVFIGLYVLFPLTFMGSLKLQTLFMFPNYDEPANPQYENFEMYDLSGVRNFYVDVADLLNSTNKIRLGVWHLVPTDLILKSQQNDFNYSAELYNSPLPIAIYFHGNGGNRIYPKDTYQVIRQFFHVIAFDYRSYGDSTAAVLTEDAVVNDAMQMYKWVQSHTRQTKIYVWGHSLGSALSTHTVKKLEETERITPMGLVLEAPFSTMRDEIYYHPVGSIFNWLPWFSATILDPLEENRFFFRSTTNIQGVNCPIMIMHAVDDAMIPVTLGEKLATVANRTRRSDQGSITFHKIPAEFKCGHIDINMHPNLTDFIRDFINEAQRFKGTS